MEPIVNNEVKNEVENNNTTPVETHEEPIIETIGEPTTQLVSCKILKVDVHPDRPKQLIFTTNTKFKHINFETGEEELTDKFSLMLYPAMVMFGKALPLIGALVDRLNAGELLSPKMFKQVLRNAEIKMVREFKAEGEAREATDDAYTADLWKTSDIKSCVSHIDALTMQLVMMDIQADKIAYKDATTQAVDIAAILNS